MWQNFSSVFIQLKWANSFFNTGALKIGLKMCWALNLSYILAMATADIYRTKVLLMGILSPKTNEWVIR